ncbi:hypothetical protein [Halalkalirubrum salinum]|uniref:hypothetical protein n=1 Tax=Halalkalirubrum salinum TaxID=2563889 RepID=UPI0010FAF173|nr:hypothetical protein [Halalkalirubrum salinum]
MAQNQLDIELYLLGPIFMVGTAASLGLIDAVWFGGLLDFGQVLFETGNIEMTIGRLLAIGSLIAVLVNRDVSFSDTNGLDVWIVYVTIGLVIAPPFFPTFAETIADTPAGIASFIVQGIGFTLVSYIN